jgi:hypothetical protein
MENVEYLSIEQCTKISDEDEICRHLDSRIFSDQDYVMNIVRSVSDTKLGVPKSARGYKQGLLSCLEGCKVLNLEDGRLVAT